MSYLVLARKWRPQGFDDLVGQEPITRILKNAVSQGRIAHAYIFSGPRGVGKTSSARILAKALNCKEGPTPAPCGICSSCIAITDGSSVDVIEIDGASNNSVDDIRDLRERVKYAPSGGKYKVYIIDEVHMLSGSAFNALLKTLEEPPPHVIFVLATTEMKKIPATVLSRCQQMPFRRISGTVIRERLRNIAEREGMAIEPQALALVARAADGSMRDSLTILDQISAFSTDITEENVKNLLGITDFNLLAKISLCLIRGDRKGIIETVNLLSEQGTDIRSFTKELVQFFRDLLVASVMRKPEAALDLTAEEMTAIREMVAESSEDQLTLMLSEILKADADVRYSSSPRLALEMALIRASFLSTMKPIRDIIENIGRYKKQAGHGGDEPVSARAAEAQRPALPATPEKDVEPEKIVEPEKNVLNTAPKPDAKTAQVSQSPAPHEEETAPAVDIEGGDIESPGEPHAGIEGSGNEGGIRNISMDDLWKRTLARVEPPLASKLAQAAVAFGDDLVALSLDGGHAVFADSIAKNIRAIEKIMSEEAGGRIRLTIGTAAKKGVRRHSLKEKVMGEPLIKEALELFDGRVVDVKPVEKNEQNINGPNGGNDVEEDAG